jgi:transcriptional regulator with XRE-family HTH domain
MSELIEEETASLHAAHFVERARKEANLSQADLAKKIGVSQARISQMEKGEGPYGLSISLLERVAAACGGVLQIEFKKAQERQQKFKLDSELERAILDHPEVRQKLSELEAKVHQRMSEHQAELQQKISEIEAEFRKLAHAG